MINKKTFLIALPICAVLIVAGALFFIMVAAQPNIVMCTITDELSPHQESTQRLLTRILSEGASDNLVIADDVLVSREFLAFSIENMSGMDYMSGLSGDFIPSGWFLLRYTRDGCRTSGCWQLVPNRPGLRHNMIQSDAAVSFPRNQRVHQDIRLDWQFGVMDEGRMLMPSGDYRLVMQMIPEGAGFNAFGEYVFLNFTIDDDTPAQIRR